jgi:hypothetical protein
MRNWNNWFWLAVGAAIISIIIMLCWPTQSISTTTPGVGWVFLKLAFVGLIVAAYASREKEQLAWTFAGMSLLVFLVLLGKLDGLMAWGTLGFPLLAAAGFWGYEKMNPGTPTSPAKTRKFLGAVSCILASFWMYLLYLDYANNFHLVFLDALLPDNTAKIICFLAVVAFSIATLKGSTAMHVLAFGLTIMLIGNNLFNTITSRWPDKLTLPTEVSDGAGSLLKSGGKAMKRWSNELDNPKPAPKPAEIVTPASSSVAPAPEKTPAQQKELNALRQKLATDTPPQSSQQSTTPVEATPQQWVADILFEKNGKSMIISGLTITQTKSDLKMASSEITMQATGNDGIHYSEGTWSDATGKSGSFTATVSADTGGTGQLSSGRTFRIARR